MIFPISEESVGRRMAARPRMNIPFAMEQALRCSVSLQGPSPPLEGTPAPGCWREALALARVRTWFIYDVV